MPEHARPDRAIGDRASNLTVTGTHPAAVQPLSQACCASPVQTLYPQESRAGWEG